MSSTRRTPPATPTTTSIMPTVFRDRERDRDATTATTAPQISPSRMLPPLRAVDEHYVHGHEQYPYHPMPSLQGIVQHNQHPGFAVGAQATPQTQHAHHHQAHTQPPPPPPPRSTRSDRSPLRTDVDAIGQPIFISCGSFAGRTIRAEVIEVQKADLGRKCADPPQNHQHPAVHAPSSNIHVVHSPTSPASSSGGGQKQKTVRKDRRPIDPPPVVELKLFEVFNAGTENQYEKEIPPTDLEMQHSKFLCQVDLFHVDSDSPTSAHSNHLTEGTDAFGGPSSPYSMRAQSIAGSSASQDAANKVTNALVGEIYTHVAVVPDFASTNHAYFVYGDLSVKLEGTFALRYRIFNLSSFVMSPPSPSGRRPSGSSMDGDLSMGGEALEGIGAPTMRIPVLAECTGGPFVVYSTKEFPGLKASTVLTKHLARWGLKVTVRGVERKRKRPGQIQQVDQDGQMIGGHAHQVPHLNASGGMMIGRHAMGKSSGHGVNVRARGRGRIRGAGDGDGAGIYDDGSESLSEDDEDSS